MPLNIENNEDLEAFRQRLIDWSNDFGVRPILLNKSELLMQLKRFNADRRENARQKQSELYQILENIEEDFAVYINEYGTPYFLVPENNLLSQWDFDRSASNELMVGQNLLTKEKIVVKIEKLSDNPEQAESRKRQLDLGAVAGKKRNTIQSHSYLIEDGRMINFQLLNWPKGQQLISSAGPRYSLRFNPYQLREDQKIEIAQKLIAALKQMHFHDHILHRNLTGNSITLSQSDDGFEVGFSDFENSETLFVKADEVYTEPNATGKSHSVEKDVEDAVNIIIDSLDLKHKTAIERLKIFAKTNPLNQHAYEKLIEDLASYQEVSDLGMDLFNQYDLPPAAPPNNKFCVLIHNVHDGIGDFMHAWDLANKMKAQLKAKGYELVALAEAFHDNDSASLPSKNSAMIKKMMADANSPFDSYLIFDHNLNDADDTFSKWQAQNQEQLNKMLPGITGAIEVSFPTSDMRRLLGDQVHTISCFQYGYTNALVNPGEQSFNPLTEAHMGLPEPNNPNSPGIKLNSDTLPIGDQRDHVFEGIKKREPHFVNNLLGEQSASEYFATHHFMPSYLQTKNAACAFVLSHVLQYKDDGKVCDFSIPKGVVDQETIKALLLRAGIQEDEIDFISPPDGKSTPTAKVRIFSYFIKDDKDFEALHRLSNDGAGCSGDNSISTVFSSPHVPFYEYKIPPIGNFYIKQLLPFIANCIKDAENINDTELKLGLEQLQEYFMHLNTMRSFGLREPNSTILPTQPPRSQEEREQELANILKDDFYRFCVKSASYLQQPAMHKAWPYLSNKLKEKHNLYDNLDNIIKGSVLLTQNDDRFLQTILAGSSEVKSLVLKGVLTEDEATSLSPRILESFTNPTIKSLIESKRLTIESLKMLFSGMIEEKKYHQKLQTNLKLYDSITAELANEPQALALFNRSPLLSVALFTKLITPAELLQLKDSFLNKDVAQWPAIIASIAEPKKSTLRFDAALQFACSQKGNELLVKNLLSFIPKEQRNEFLKVLRVQLKKEGRLQDYDAIIKSELAAQRPRAKPLILHQLPAVAHKVGTVLGRKSDKTDSKNKENVNPTNASVSSTDHTNNTRKPK